MKTAIIGAATGYHPEYLNLFLHSLNHIGYRDDVVLFIYQNQIHDFKKHMINKNFNFDIKLIESSAGFFYSKKINRKLKKYINLLSRIAVSFYPKLQSKMIYKLAFPHVARFFDYLSYIENNTDLTHIILTDTRDVIFQKNPICNNIDGLYLGLENDKISIGSDPYHIKWISEVYGNSYLEKIREKQICCAGVTLGNYLSIQKYLHAMINEFLTLPYKTIIYSNYDQGIHNKLLYNNELNNVISCQPLDSIISTIGIIERKELKFDVDNNLLLSDGSIASIVHQYDRHLDILEKFNQKYSK